MYQILDTIWNIIVLKYNNYMWFCIKSHYDKVMHKVTIYVLHIYYIHIA